ncbi:hypothetical protein J7K19_07680 [bacterium]|nr:hypothetical protein [bacterium]
MKFAKQPSSEALYVAPLHLDKNQYYNSLFNSVNRFRPFPFIFRSYHLHYHFLKWVSYFCFVPYLKEHISIIPHERIDTHKHYYSYSITGDDIVWHSPEIISRSPSRLSDSLKKIIRKHVEENMLFGISKINSDLKIDEIRTNEKRDPFEQLQAKAKELNQKYSIKLMLFLINYEYEEKYLV